MPGSSAKGALPTPSPDILSVLAFSRFLAGEKWLSGPRNLRPETAPSEEKGLSDVSLRGQVVSAGIFPTPGDLPLLLLAGVGHMAFLTQYLANQRGYHDWLKLARIHSWQCSESLFSNHVERGSWHGMKGHPCWQVTLGASSHSGLWAAFCTDGMLFCHIWFSVDTLLNCLVSVDIHTISRYRINCRKS